MLRISLCQNRQLWLVFLTYVFIATLALTASAADVSELLEKAIYTEETVGDLDKAIAAYEKVVAESKGSIDSAAQAKFRIGTCYAKQGNDAKATEAFQAVIDNYPKATEWVAKAKSRLPGSPELLPVPWGDGDELHFEMKLPTGMSVGHQVFRIGKVEKNGRKLWECSAWQTVVINGMSGNSRVLADLENFAPVESAWKHTMLGDSKATYGKNSVVIEMKSKDEPLTIKYDGPVYDNEQAAELFRRLPLKVGYKTKVDIIPILTGTKINLGVEVTKLEEIEVPAGKFECFKLFLEDLNQTFWVSNDEHRYLVRFAAGGVTADLVKIQPYQANRSAEHKDKSFSLTLPPDWFAYSPSDKKGEDKTRTALIGPSAAINARVRAATRESVEKERGTAREWLEWGLSDNADHFKDYVLSDKGIEAITVNGQEAYQAIYEHTQGKNLMKTRRINLYGDTSAIDVRFTIPAKEYEKWQPAIDEILAGLKAK